MIDIIFEVLSKHPWPYKDIQLYKKDDKIILKNIKTKAEYMININEIVAEHNYDIPVEEVVEQICDKYFDKQMSGDYCTSVAYYEVIFDGLKEKFPEASDEDVRVAIQKAYYKKLITKQIGLNGITLLFEQY